MERCPEDGKPTLVEFVDQSDLDDASPKEIIMVLASCALSLYEQMGYICYPVFKVDHV